MRRKLRISLDFAQAADVSGWSNPGPVDSKISCSARISAEQAAVVMVAHVFYNEGCFIFEFAQRSAIGHVNEPKSPGANCASQSGARISTCC
jgi:hypothetical protein